MTATLGALIGVMIMILEAGIWLLVAYAILSWLIAFNVINTQNEFVRGVVRGLDRLFDPMLRPIRRLMPDLGGIDLSPLVLFIAFEGGQMLLSGVGRDLLN